MSTQKYLSTRTRKMLGLNLVVQPVWWLLTSVANTDDWFFGLGALVILAGTMLLFIDEKQ
jgi:hypothetical protein